ncbi:Deubiquitinating enzyme A [Aphelenchoides fujianensis]|nr:Deubiquitinating enzyme A [Aphelenchoides fujianensis]
MTILPKVKKSHPRGERDHGQRDHGPRDRDHGQKAHLNSDDEYGPGFKDDALEVAFVESMKKNRGFNVKVVKGDGACMFRAVADQIYGDEEMHHDVRRLSMDYIAKNRDHFSQFITEDFNEYLTRKRNVDVHGNHVELQAISEIFLRPIEIYEYGTEPINTFHPISREANTGQVNPPIRLSYHGSVHYNSVVDPFTPTIGVGLGLPGHVPGAADRNLMREATLASERHHIEEAMLKDKMKMTDWEHTEKELERQIANESYLEFLQQTERQGEQRRLKAAHPPAAVAQPADRPLPHEPKETAAGRAAGRSAPPTTRRRSGRRAACRAPNAAPRRPTCRPAIHRNEASASMPNIDATFGASLNGSSAGLMKPTTSVGSLKELLDAPVEASTSNELVPPEEKAGTSKEGEAARPPLGLYEELLATTADRVHLLWA